MNATAEVAGSRQGDHGHHDEGRGHHECPTTHVIVNNGKVYVHLGRIPLATLKKLAGIPQAHQIDELVGGTLKEVPDNASLNLTGCEIFVSRVPDGVSS